LPLWQHDFHDVQALVVVHLRPVRDLSAAAQAAFAEALVVEVADTDARTEHGAEEESHGITISAGT
jgi:hypothetical protein